LSSKEVLRLLGYGEDHVLKNGDVLGSGFDRQPVRVGRLAAALAAQFSGCHIDTVVGFGHTSALLAAFVAQNLSGCGVNACIEAAPLWPHVFEEGAVVIDPDDVKRISGRRVLVVAPEASRVILVKKVSDFCRAKGASWIGVGLIVNFGCDASSLGADGMVRSLVLERPV